MLITHAQNLKAPKSQTPKRKIKHIVTAKNQLLQPSMKNPSNAKLSIDNKQNKENQNPNIRKSPSPRQQKPIPYQSTYQTQYPTKEARIKSQYYTSSIPTSTVRQSPIKKILFVKNLSYKSAKTSKNSSLDNKKQQPSHASQYLSVGAGSNKQDSQRVRDQRRSYSHYNSSKSIIENQSQIYVENRLSQKPIHDTAKPKDMFLANNQSQASYRLSPNQQPNLKNPQYFQKFNTTQIANHKYSMPQKHSGLEYNTTNLPTQNPHPKPSKMCPNIDASGLAVLESFKNNKYLFPSKNQKDSLNKHSLCLDKEKKESLSSKKRNSRMKVNYKNNEKHRQSLNEDNLTEQSQIMVSSPSHPNFEQNYSKFSTANQQYTSTSGSQKGTKSTSSKQPIEQSTLVQTRKFDDTFQNLNSEFFKISLNQSKNGDEEMVGHVEEKRSGRRFCTNHPEKQAKFKLNKDINEPFYCSKCTVLLVTQGYKVVENLQDKSHRLQKLKSLIFDIEIIQPKLKSAFQSLTRLETQASSIQSEAQKQIQAYYSNLIKTLQNHKQTAIKSVHYHTTKVIQEIESIRKKLIENEGEIGFMKGDILPNVDLIVDEDRIPESTWKQIITQHETKLQTVKIIAQNIATMVQGKGENKLMIKNVLIPTHELKSALNVLQRTQIVLNQKVLKIQPYTHNNLIYRAQHNSPTNMDQTKLSFSFDDENIETSFYVPSSKKKQQQISPEGVENVYELTDSIRLSFGNRFDNSGNNGVQSPTFKAI